MESGCVTEEDMAEIKKEALERLRPYLCEKLVADRHLDYLRSRRVLTRDDAEDICCRKGSTKKTGRMLDYLEENPRGLDYLVESICRVRTKDFVIKKITSEVEKVKLERRNAAILLATSTAFTSPVCVCKEGSSFGCFQSETGYNSSSEAQSFQTSWSHLEDKSGHDGSAFSWSNLDEGFRACPPASLPKPGEQGGPSVPTEDVEPGNLLSECTDEFQTLCSCSTPSL